MNIIEESFETKKVDKSKKIARLILAFIIILIIAVIAIVCTLMYLKNSALKITINGKVNEKLVSQLVFENDDTIYVPIREIAKYLGYESYNGEYSQKSEEISKCYIKCDDEIANFKLNSNKVYKLNLENKSSNYEYFYMDKPVKAIKGQLYITTDGMQKAFNVSFTYNRETNRMAITTMPYLITSYKTKVMNYGYAEIVDNFENHKAILDGMLIVSKDKDDDKIGVINAKTGEAIIEAKYNDITYLQNTKDFLVKDNGKVGIISKDKKTKVEIAYDKIELIDSDAGLYLVQKDKKYGVIDLKGNVVIYIEYDQIGIDNSKFAQNDIKNKYLLLDTLIPVQKDKLWGLYDKDGNLVVETKYDSLGYISSNNKTAYNLLIIPNYNVLVACKNGKYTLINTSGKEIFPPVADDIYMTIASGKKSYYINYNDKTMDAEGYLDNTGVEPNVESTSNDTNYDDENTDTSDVVENNTTENENTDYTTNERKFRE